MDDLGRVAVERPGQAHAFDSQRGEQAVLDHRLVGPAGDLFDEQAEQAVVEVRVAVRRPWGADHTGAQTDPGGGLAGVRLTTEERPLVGAEARCVREQLADGDPGDGRVADGRSELRGEHLADGSVELDLAGFDQL